MSIMMVQLVSDGILFGADRNITTSLSAGGGQTFVSGQSQRPKVLKWPNHELVIGYVGRAEIGGTATDEWLYDFIGRNLFADRGQPSHSDLEQLTDELRSRLEFDISRQGGVADSPMVLRLGGFVEDAGQWKPEVWQIRNATANSRYRDVQDRFSVLESVSSEFAGLTGDEVMRKAAGMAADGHPYWFHDGFDLDTFNTIEHVLRVGMQLLIQDSLRPDPVSLPYPESLQESGKHLKMAILTYGSYFNSFFEPFEQYVGGGADVVWAARPQIPPLA